MMDVPPLSTPVTPDAQANVADTSKTGAAESFEALFLSQFVDEMMKTVDPSAFGGEQNAHMWRSFMSEAVSKHLAESGGFGFGTSIQRALGAYERTTG